MLDSLGSWARAHMGPVHLAPFKQEVPPRSPMQQAAVSARRWSPSAATMSPRALARVELLAAYPPRSWCCYRRVLFGTYRHVSGRPVLLLIVCVGLSTYVMWVGGVAMIIATLCVDIFFRREMRVDAYGD